MSWLHSIGSFLHRNSSWMAWNLLLALIPFVLSVLLFQPGTPRLTGRSHLHGSLWWWLGILVFVAFLPNAPYVVTDLIHLVRDIQKTDSLLFNSLVILPTYLLFVMVGFEAYVLCLINLGRFLQQQGLGQWVVPIELLLHSLCAIGIYLGRIERFNSWDLVTRPGHVLQSTIASAMSSRSLFFILLAASVITLLYAALKVITQALLLQRHYMRRLERRIEQTELSE